MDCIAHGLSDEQQKVRVMMALGLAALVEAAALMDPEYASYYTKEVTVILIKWMFCPASESSRHSGSSHAS